MKNATVNRKTSVNVAYQCILNKIISREFSPGMPLREVHLAHELNLSPTPVREAMRCLEYEGWLQSIPFRGRVVRRMTAEDVRGSFLLREGIECMAIRCFAENASAEIRDEMRRELELESVYPVECSDAQRDEFRKLDLHFHELLFMGANIPTLTDLHARIRAQLQLLYRGKAKTTPPEIYREHRMIFDALEANLIPAAEVVMHHHIRRAMLNCLKKESL